MPKFLRLVNSDKLGIVDDDIFEFINQWEWKYSNAGTGYIVRYEDGKIIYIHMFIMNTPKGMKTDHVDGDGLNNLRENLRVCTHSENMRNRSMRKDNSSGYKGVSWYAPLDKWRADIKLNGKTLFLKYFVNVQDAALAYDNAARMYYGEYAKTNFQ